MRKYISFFVLLILITITSCNSLFLPDATPTWAINIPQNSKKWVYFYGYGNATNVQLAKNRANIDVLESVASYIGSDISETYYREISDNSSVVGLGMDLYREADLTLSDGSIEYHVLYRANRTILEDNFSDEYKEILETENRIENLLSLALEDYKENNDVESISKLLNALSLSLTFPVRNEEYSSEVLLDKVLGQLSELKIKVSKVKSDKGEAEVKLVRTYGLFHPPVKNANVSARFMTYEPLANQVESSIIYKTDDRGKFLFTPINPYMVKEGTVTFYLDMETELYNLALVAPVDYVKKINDVIANIQISFDYSIESKGSAESVGIILNEFNEEGRKLNTSFAQDTFVEYFESQNVLIKSVSSVEEELELAIEDVKANYPELRYLIWGRVGSVDSVMLGSDISYSISGDIYLVDLSTKEILKEERLASVASWNESSEVALTEGFKKYGKLIAVKYISQF